MQAIVMMAIGTAQPCWLARRTREGVVFGVRAVGAEEQHATATRHARSSTRSR